MGNVLRHLVAKSVVLLLRDQIAIKLRPTQLGFGTPSGCEAAVYTSRRYLSQACEVSLRDLLKVYYLMERLPSQSGFHRYTLWWRNTSVFVVPMSVESGFMTLVVGRVVVGSPVTRNDPMCPNFWEVPSVSEPVGVCSEAEWHDSHSVGGWTSSSVGFYLFGHPSTF